MLPKVLGGGALDALRQLTNLRAFPPFIEVPVSLGEHLSPRAVLEKTVMQALGVADPNLAKRFLADSGMTWSETPPRLAAPNGGAVYRFEPAPEFWSSVVNFLKREASGAPPNLASPPFAPADAVVNRLAADPGVARLRAGLHQGREVRLAPSLNFASPAGGRQNPAPASAPSSPAPLTRADGTPYAAADLDRIAETDVFTVRVAVGEDDTRETMLRAGYAAAARAAGYAPAEAERLAAALLEQNRAAGDARLRDSATQTPRDEARYAHLRARGEMAFTVTGAHLKRFDQLHCQKRLIDAIASGAPLDEDVIRRSGADRDQLLAKLKEIGWKPLPTYAEAVEKVAAERTAEVMERKATARRVADPQWGFSKWYGMTDDQIAAECRREAETEVRRQIGAGELAVRRERREPAVGPHEETLSEWARPLIERYAPGLATLNTPEGVRTLKAEAFAAGFINATTFGATDLYVDRSRFTSEAEFEAAQVAQTAGQIAGEIRNLAKAGRTVEAAVAGSPGLQARLGALAARGPLGAAAARAIVSGTAFSLPEGARQAVNAAQGDFAPPEATMRLTEAAGTGALFGVLHPLPLGVRAPAAGAGSYGIEKALGARDKEAATSAAANMLLATVGGRAKELDGKVIRVTGENGTAANVRATLEGGRLRLREVGAEIRADFAAKVSDLKTAARRLGPEPALATAGGGRRAAVEAEAKPNAGYESRALSPGEFRTRYGAETTGSPRLRERLGEIERLPSGKAQNDRMREVEADVLLGRLTPTERAEVERLAATNQEFIKQCGNAFERLSVEATAAQSEVAGATAKLASGRKDFYGKPDGVRTTPEGLINEVEEAKFFGKDKIEALATAARTNPRSFALDKLEKDQARKLKLDGNSHIQFNKHAATITEIGLDPSLVKGAAVKGVSENVKYVLTLPRFEGDDQLAVRAAVKDMQKAWKSKLGIDVEVRYSDYSVNDIQLMVERLRAGRK
jgi:hypothetical protein